MLILFLLSVNLLRFILDDETFDDGMEGNITMIPLKRKKKDPSEYFYFFNTTAETEPPVQHIVQTEYTTTEIGE